MVSPVASRMMAKQAVLVYFSNGKTAPVSNRPSVCINDTNTSVGRSNLITYYGFFAQALHAGEDVFVGIPVEFYFVQLPKKRTPDHSSGKSTQANKFVKYFFQSL